MRKLLLFLIAVSVIGISSCTKDEVNEISQEEKVLLVKQMVVELDKIVKAGKYQQFTFVLSQKTENENLSDEEVEALFLEIFGEKSHTFVNLYYQLKAINMTGEEFLSIANQFDFLILETKNVSGKSADYDCSIGSVWCAILDWVGQQVSDDKEEPDTED